jgi:hypothetical protein
MPGLGDYFATNIWGQQDEPSFTPSPLPFAQPSMLYPQPQSPNDTRQPVPSQTMSVGTNSPMGIDAAAGMGELQRGQQPLDPFSRLRAPLGGFPTPAAPMSRLEVAQANIPLPQIELNSRIPNQLPEVTARYNVPLRNGDELFATGQYQHMLQPGQLPSWGLHMGYRRRF